MLEVVLVEHGAHEIALFDADPVLAGQNAADFDTELENVGAELLGLFKLARIVGIVKDQGMQVAVAGVEHIGDAQPMELFDSSFMRPSTLGSWWRGIVPSMQ